MYKIYLPGPHLLHPRMEEPVIVLDAMIPHYMKAYLKVLGYVNVYHLRDLYPLDVGDEYIRQFVESKEAVLITRDRKHFNTLKKGKVLILEKEDPYWMFKEALEGLMLMGLTPRFDWIKMNGKTE
ncbi:MAG: hypothetical protein QXM89_01405 [Candidatus Bathyarchaeia archaeon]